MSGIVQNQSSDLERRHAVKHRAAKFESHRPNAQETGHVCCQNLLVLAGLVLCILTPLRWQYRLSCVIGESMLPTLAPHELLVVDKVAYANREPERGDIVVARVHGELLVKRIIALPGEEVEVKNGVVYINDEALSEQDHTSPGPLNISKGKLFEGKYAILGDNRSLALPVHAVISRDQILGKVVWRGGRARGLGAPE